MVRAPVHECRRSQVQSLMLSLLCFNIYRVPVEHRPSHMFGGSSCQDVTSQGGMDVRGWFSSGTFHGLCLHTSSKQLSLLRLRMALLILVCVPYTLRFSIEKHTESTCAQVFHLVVPCLPCYQPTLRYHAFSHCFMWYFYYYHHFTCIHRCTMCHFHFSSFFHLSLFLCFTIFS